MFLYALAPPTSFVNLGFIDLQTLNKLVYSCFYQFVIHYILYDQYPLSVTALHELCPSNEYIRREYEDSSVHTTLTTAQIQKFSHWIYLVPFPLPMSWIWECHMVLKIILFDRLANGRHALNI